MKDCLLNAKRQIPMMNWLAVARQQELAQARWGQGRLLESKRFLRHPCLSWRLLCRNHCGSQFHRNRCL